MLKFYTYYDIIYKSLTMLILNQAQIAFKSQLKTVDHSCLKNQRSCNPFAIVVLNNLVVCDCEPSIVVYLSLWSIIISSCHHCYMNYLVGLYKIYFREQGIYAGFLLLTFTFYNSNIKGILGFYPYFPKITAIYPYFEIIQIRVPILKLDFNKIEL